MIEKGPTISSDQPAEKGLPPPPEDIWERLGVEKTASEVEITEAHHRLLRQYHPDRHPNDPMAAEWTSKLNTARDEALGKGGELGPAAQRIKNAGRASYETPPRASASSEASPEALKKEKLAAAEVQLAALRHERGFSFGITPEAKRHKEAQMETLRKEAATLRGSSLEEYDEQNEWPKWQKRFEAQDARDRLEAARLALEAAKNMLARKSEELEDLKTRLGAFKFEHPLEAAMTFLQNIEMRTLRRAEGNTLRKELKKTEEAVAEARKNLRTAFQAAAIAEQERNHLERH